MNVTQFLRECAEEEWRGCAWDPSLQVLHLPGGSMLLGTGSQKGCLTEHSEVGLLKKVSTLEEENLNLKFILTILESNLDEREEFI